ncbi:unnamed protein product [Pedinophyceae sp. YPF-701]|nr:unnamed protein product [Pedinophyceae sp. YPF-701]
MSSQEYDRMAIRVATAWSRRWTAYAGRTKPHPAIQDYARELFRALAPVAKEDGSELRVLVPFSCCAADVRYLHGQGMAVVGVDSPGDSVDALEAGLGLTQSSGRAHDGWIKYDGDGVTVLRGNPVAVTTVHLSLAGRPHLIFDRVGLSMLPREGRRAYARALRKLLPAGGMVLAVAVSSVERVDDGAASVDFDLPAEVSMSEVREAFGGDGMFEVSCLGFTDASGLPEYQAGGGEDGVAGPRITEMVYLMVASPHGVGGADGGARETEQRNGGAAQRAGDDWFSDALAAKEEKERAAVRVEKVDPEEAGKAVVRKVMELGVEQAAQAAAEEAGLGPEGARVLRAWMEAGRTMGKMGL